MARFVSLLVLVAIPLGVQPTRSARSHGFTVSLILIFLYYILLSAGQGLAEHALVPAVVGLWLPNVALGALGLVLFRRAGRERTVIPLVWIDGVTAFVRRRLAGPPGAEIHP